jgi:uncharacterized protein (TIGR00369 family)
MTDDAVDDHRPTESGQAAAAPAPYVRHDRRSGLTDPWEPLYSHYGQDAVWIGLRAAAPHANSRGFVHGGLLTALADNAMGLSCVHARGDPGVRLVTVNLAMDFISTARIGQWVEVRPTVIKTGSNLCFASALVLADGKACARANATFATPSR